MARVRLSTAGFARVPILPQAFLDAAEIRLDFFTALSQMKFR
jgi:hypothetical protein